MDYEEEDRRDAAARCIQRKYRVYHAKKSLRALIRQNYVKLYDKARDLYLYKNKTTGDISSRKPVSLGNEDLPTPRQYAAPQGYKPSDCMGERGFALIITVNSFPNAEKLEEVASPATNADHVEMESIFPHEFLCRFRSEDIIILKNPVCADIKESLTNLRQMVKKSAFLVVYIATHVLTVVKGEKTNKSEDSYFAMRDTFWGSPKVIAQSSISLSYMCELLNRIVCERKTIFVNYAHHKRPNRSLIPSSKKIYPPPTFLIRFAEMSNSAVIGACSIETKLSDTLAHTPLLSPKSESESMDANDDEIDGVSIMSDLTKKTRDTDRQSLKGKLLPNDASSRETRKSLGNGTNKHSSKIQDDQGSEMISNEKKEEVLKLLVETLISDWKIEKDPEIVLSPRPSEPEATWLRNEVTGYELKIELPSKQDMTQYERNVAYWHFKRFFRPPVNFLRSAWRYHKFKNLRAPAQTSLVYERRTMFGESLAEGLQGKASKPSSHLITVEDMFLFMCSFVKEKLVLMAASTSPDQTDPPPNQTPTLIVPANNHQAVLNPVCLRVAQPPAPEAPFVVRVGYDEVLLEWYNPSFDGIAPTCYKIFMKNVSRSYKTWREVSFKGLIKTTKFLVKNLPSGVSCKFRVKAFNNGGWSDLSDESIMVCPGEEQQPLPLDIKWTRLGLGGPLAVLDRLNRYPFHRADHLLGLRALSNFGQRDVGFKRTNIATRTAQVAVRALKTFLEDREICSLCFFILGWCLKSKGSEKVFAMCIESKVVEFAEHYMEIYRCDSRVINSIAWLRGHEKMKALIPDFPKIVVEAEEIVSESDDEDEK